MHPASDTDPKALEVLIEFQRRMPPSEKIARVFEATHLMPHLIEAEERRLHPDASDREIFLRAAAHRLGWETVRKVYGWSPDDVPPTEICASGRRVWA